MTTLDFLVFALVLRVLAYCWFKADLWPLPELRATAEAYEAQEVETLTVLFCTALKCPYCSVHHFGALLAVVPLLYRDVSSWWLLPLAVGYGWAAGELVWLTDEYLPDRLSYHRRVVSTYDGSEPNDAA